MNDIALAGMARSGLRPASAGPAERLAGTTALVVLGMHRSGTSALTGMLNHLGVALGERLMPATQDNPRGYWEHADVVKVHERRLMAALGWAWSDIRSLPSGFERGEPAQTAWAELTAILDRDFAGTALWGVKDPRLCRLMPLWSALLTAEDVTPRFVLALRHPLDVAASLATRDRIGVARGLLLWLGHLLDAERATRGATRVIIQYEDLIGPGGWRRIADEIADTLGFSWPQAGAAAEAAIDAFLARWSCVAAGRAMRPPHRCRTGSPGPTTRCGPARSVSMRCATRSPASLAWRASSLCRCWVRRCRHSAKPKPRARRKIAPSSNSRSVSTGPSTRPKKFAASCNAC
jgi:hypothetical protein